MKSFAKKMLIFIAPAVVAVVLFFVFEPYDYFGLKHNSHYLSKPLSTMREVIRDHPKSIILGDSQMANLNIDYIEELTGTRYTMLGFGGSRSVLSVNIEAAGHHPATLGVGLTTGCWATRRGDIMIHEDLSTEILSHKKSLEV